MPIEKKNGFDTFPIDTLTTASCPFVNFISRAFSSLTEHYIYTVKARRETREGQV